MNSTRSPTSLTTGRVGYILAWNADVKRERTKQQETQSTLRSLCFNQRTSEVARPMNVAGYNSETLHDYIPCLFLLLTKRGIYTSDRGLIKP
jgi:hypothetical protein